VCRKLVIRRCLGGAAEFALGRVRTVWFVGKEAGRQRFEIKGGRGFYHIISYHIVSYRSTFITLFLLALLDRSY